MYIQVCTDVSEKIVNWNVRQQNKENWDAVIFIPLTEVCFLVSYNGFLQIFCNCLKLDEMFSWHSIEHLVCRKMCSKHFENRLTNKEVLAKNIFE